MDFTDARHVAKMSRFEVMEDFEISKATLHRYESSGKAPKAIIGCLLMIGGRVPTFKHHKSKGSFLGWSFSNGYLHSDSGNRYTSGDILAMYPDRELIKELTRKNEQLKKQALKSVSNNVYHFPAIHKKYINSHL